jgi:Putative esterase
MVGAVFGLTSAPLLLLAIAVAVCAPLTLVYLWVRGRVPGGRRSRLGVGAVVLSLALVSQLAAVAVVGLAVNRRYDFYGGWADLLGKQSSASDVIRGNGGLDRGRGRLEVLPIDGRRSHTRSEMLVWLPPQYTEPAYRHRRFPVVEFLPGQPEQPAGVFRGFELVSSAQAAISSGRVPPFVLVVPPLMIRPPSDTECTNVPHGPQALTWLASDVPHAITSRLRVDPPGRHWSVMGWSTGGFCAAKLVYAYPRVFAAAVGLGGYYQPSTDRTWPNLFGGLPSVRRHNSPQWLYAHRSSGLTARLLIVSSRQDGESWRSSAKMIAATRDNPHVSRVVVPSGGHNFGVYRPYVGPGLRWLTRQNVLG